MTTKQMKTKLILSSLAVLSALCAAPSFALTSAPGTTRIEIEMSPEAARSLGAPEKTDVSEASLRVYESGQVTEEMPVSLATRGQTSLKKFARKNYSLHAGSVEGEKKHGLQISGIKGKGLILSAGAQDALLVKNMISYRLLSAAQITALEAHYAEVVINQRSQGLYMITDSPDDYLIKVKDADIVIRRRYNDVFELKKANKKLSEEEIGQYLSSINELNQILSSQKGEELLSTLTSRMNLDHYMRWLAVNFILKNGDYSDEAFFYGTKSASGQIYFDIMPWDLDDTFQAHMHLSRIPGHYNFMRKKRSERQMLYNFESALDRAISQDSVLLKKYFDVMAQVSSEISAGTVDQIINQVQSELAPYLQDPDVLANGARDEAKQPHDPTAVQADLESKRAFIKARLAAVQSEIQKIQAEGGDRSKAISKIELKLGRFIMKIVQHFAK